MTADAPSPLLQIDRLTVATRRGRSILDRITLDLDRRETLAIVGESGCGKSTLAVSIMGLLPTNLRATGSVRFGEAELQGLPEKRLRAFRGTRIAMIFQNPFTSLNPALRVGDQIAEMLEVHLDMSRAEAWRRATELLEQVEIPRAAERMQQYPHEFSGGMQQRAMIAIAISCQPELLIADEPTTALDVTVQARILELLRRLTEENQMSLIVVSHDLAVVAQLVDEIAVMYAGRIVERAPSDSLFENPQHPYTRALLAAVPSLDDDVSKPLSTIPGSVESGRGSDACRFAPRCPFAEQICRDQAPSLENVGELPGMAACWIRPWRPTTAQTKPAEPRS